MPELARLRGRVSHCVVRRLGFLVLLISLFGAVPALAGGQNGPRPGSAAPAFALPDVGGKVHRLEDLRGKPVLLNFWAFWCDTWKEELPHLKELAARQDELGFRLVALSVDGTRLQQFLKGTGGRVPFPVLLDAGGKVSARYHVARVPTLVLVDARGVVRWVRSGFPGNQVLLNEVRKLSGASVPRPPQGGSRP